ncbi:molybdopterin synthase catalytic subunit [Mycetocola sp. CAN_C7]|uniref:molybdenum cofactor biosynthesis protein MoaE n=1 Tax=Mycetocola sp. CAN_C7 TaxID=2787724 RepID=UPI0018C8DDE3
MTPDDIVTAGATGTVRVASVTADPIELDALRAAVTDDSRGAVVTFEGVVRDHDDDRSVAWLSYSGHPSAEDALRAAAESVCQDFPAVAVAVAHRIGRLEVGGLALGCAVASAHRAEAFQACGALVDRVKESVPIWKEQAFVDGGTEWVQAIG